MNPPQKDSVAPRITEPPQCYGCPPGNSLPLLPYDNVCFDHSWMNVDNGAASCLYED